MMRFVQHNSDGQLSIAEQNMPEISSNQVLIKVSAFGVNRADILQKFGKYPAPAGASSILGLDVAGDIYAVGDNVSNVQVGDRVCAMLAGGGYAEYVAVDSNLLIPTPSSIEDSKAASIPEVFLTAYQVLYWIGQVQPEHKVLIHAGASGVGLAAIQLAKQAGAKVAVTCSSEAKNSKCRALGADLTINYNEQDYLQVIKREWCGVDLVIDMVAGAYTNKNLKLLNVDGTIINLAILGGRYVENFDSALMLGKRASLIGTTLRNRELAYKVKLTQEFTQRFLPKFKSGELTCFVDTCFPVKDIDVAHARMQQNDSIGKFVVTW